MEVITYPKLRKNATAETASARLSRNGRVQPRDEPPTKFELSYTQGGKPKRQSNTSETH